ncbi:MAG: hypothetical protein SGPRY_010566, partial [Prymnesium sp.]
VIHTAEVVVPPDSLYGCDGECEEWRRTLIESEAESGCDRAFHAWWVPEIAVERCPLFAAARAKFVSEDELVEGTPADVLRAPIGKVSYPIGFKSEASGIRI